MPKQGAHVSIGINVDYQKSLQEMTNAYKMELTKLSNQFTKLSEEFKELEISKDAAQQIEVINKKFDTISKTVENTFEKINNGKLDASAFEQYQREITKEFSKIEKDVEGLSGQILALDKKIDTLNGADIATGIKKQFDDLSASILNSYNEISKVIGIVHKLNNGDLPAVVDTDVVKQAETYKKTLAEIQKIRDNTEEIATVDIDGYKKAVQELKNLDNERQRMEKESAASSEADRAYNDSKVIEIYQKEVTLVGELIGMYEKLSTEEQRTVINPKEIKTLAMENAIKKYIQGANEFIKQNEKMVASYKEAQNQLDASATEFKVKNGAIHVPIKLDANNTDLTRQLNDIINNLAKAAEKKSIIAKVKLVLDNSSSKSYKTNAEIDKQIAEAQKEPGLDITKTMDKAYRDAVRRAEATAKEEIRNIKEKLGEVKVAIKPDAEAFEKDLTKMVNSTLSKVSKEGFNLNVNEELNKLIGSLKELSNSFAGNEGFKFGLDEASITRITDAIENMANMFQRVFKVASDNDIAAQWASIEEKFKSVAGEEEKLLKGNKEHKVAIQELAIEYKKYVDMGGQNDLSTLTQHKQTVKNLTQEYENLGKVVQETVQKQEKQSTTTKVSKEEAEAIKSTSRVNKTLETQAEKTSTAIENEGNSAQTASTKFRKLAKEKGAAVVANRELAKAAKETADALERESKARKESGSSKPNKNAIDEEVYNNNAIKWQESIKQSLIDSGQFAEVFGAQISRSEKGLVKFTASVQDADGAWRKLTATVDSSGNIKNPKFVDLNEKQIASIERAKKAISDINSESLEEPISYTREQLEKYISTIREAGDALDNFKIKKISLNDDGSLSIATEFKDASGQVQNFIAKFDDVNTVINAISDSTKGLGSVLEESFDSGKVSTTLKDFSNLGRVLSEQTFGDINEVRNNLDSLLVTMGKVNEKSIKVKNMKTLTAEVKAANGEIRNITINLDENGFAHFVDNGIAQFSRLREAAENVFKGIKSLVRIYLSPQDFIRYFRQGFDTVKEIDTSMTELKKVSDASGGELASYFDDAVTSAKELGSSVNDMIAATADWSRMGYNLPDSKKLGEIAVLYKNVGDGIDIDEANSSLVSTLQGFQMEASEAIDIVDKFNEVAKHVG